jgi:asparagine synthase (glutamine-hydrolysing)
MTMANSIEGRSPFLDHKLMEFAARIPANIKMPDGQLKWILKQAGLKYFSHEFLNRPKQGFGVPLDQWFRTSLKDFAADMLTGPQAASRGLFEMKYVRRLLEEHWSGRQEHQYRLWALLMFELWARTFLDRADPLSGPLTF